MSPRAARADLTRAARAPVPLCDPSLQRRLTALMESDEPGEPPPRPWTFTLRLRGYYGFGVEEPLGGAETGLATRVRARLRLEVEVLHGGPGLDPGDHGARLAGTFRSGALGGARPLRHGAAVVVRTEQSTPILLGYQLHLTGWENIPVTVRGQWCMVPASTRSALGRPALTLEMWRDATDGVEPEQLVATGLLRAGPLTVLRAAVGFCRSAPPGARPVRLLRTALLAVLVAAWQGRARGQR